MKTPKDLLNLMCIKADNQHLVLGKWETFTFQYDTGLGLAGLNSRLTVWQYSSIILEISYKQLTVNDKKKIKVESQIENGIWIERIMNAIERDQTIAIGGIQQLWRIGIGGYLAHKRASKRSQTT